MVSRIPLDNVCEKKIETLPSQYDGKIEYIDISSIDNLEKIISNTQIIDSKEAPSRARQLVKYGDILVSTVRPNLNAVTVIEKESEHVLVASTGYCVLRCNSEVDNHYVFHFCQSPYFIEDMVRQATGASYPAVSNSIVRSCLMPLRNLEEQRHISTILDKVSNLISLRKQQLAKLDELVKVRFVEMFDGRYPVFVIGDKLHTASGGTPSKAHREFYENGTVPWLTSGEVNTGVICSVKKYISELGMNNSSAKLIPKDSVIIAMYGATAGQVGLLQIETTTNQAVCSILPNQGYIPEYLYYAIKSKKDWMISQCAGGAQPNISQSIIKKMQIIDAPLNAQRNFSLFVKRVENSKLTIQRSLDKMEVLKKSLMQEYFG